MLLLNEAIPQLSEAVGSIQLAGSVQVVFPVPV